MTVAWSCRASEQSYLLVGHTFFLPLPLHAPMQPLLASDLPCPHPQPTHASGMRCYASTAAEAVPHPGIPFPLCPALPQEPSVQQELLALSAPARSMDYIRERTCAHNNLLVMLLANLTSLEEGAAALLQCGKGPLEGLHL
jgi:hypothetical protein